MVTVAYTGYVSVAARTVPEERRAQFRAHHQRRGSIMLCRILGIRIRTVGALPRDRHLLVVSNHFGILDPFILAAVLPVSFVGKAEIRDWPIGGWVAREFNVIFVERERRPAVQNFVESIRARMRRNVPVLVFPEGTTSGSEKLLPFKTGAFASVVGMVDAAVLPVYLRAVRASGVKITAEHRRLVSWAGGNESFLQNLRRMLEMRSFDVEVCIGTPIALEGHDRKSLTASAQAQVEALRDAAPAAAKDTFVE